MEVRKLQTDILFVKLSFVVQIINTIGIIALGALVFLFFQRPQVEQMREAHLLNEKQQVASGIEKAIAIKDRAQRTVAFRVLKDLWPTYPAILVAEETQNLLDEPIRPIGAREECWRARVVVNDLEKARERLEAQLRAEVLGLDGRKAGPGPIARALQDQLADLRAKIETARRVTAACGGG